MKANRLLGSRRAQSTKAEVKLLSSARCQSIKAVQPLGTGASAQAEEGRRMAAEPLPRTSGAVDSVPRDPSNGLGIGDSGKQGRQADRPTLLLHAPDSRHFCLTLILSLTDL